MVNKVLDIVVSHRMQITMLGIQIEPQYKEGDSEAVEQPGRSDTVYRKAGLELSALGALLRHDFRQ